MKGWIFDPSYSRSSFFPPSNNAYDLGSAALGWRTAYLTTSIKFTGTTGLIAANSSDGSDNAVNSFAGGGAATQSRGAYISAHGNEHANVGNLELYSGDNSSAVVKLDGKSQITQYVNGTETLRTSGGSLRFTSTGNEFDIYSLSSNSKALRLQGGNTNNVNNSSFIKLESVGYLGTGDIDVHLTSSASSTTGKIRLTVEKSDQTVSHYYGGTELIQFNISREMIFTGGSGAVRFDTSDGSDNRDFTIYGGGAVSTDGTRGAYIRVSGNEASGVGSISMRSGTASGASIVLDCYSSDGVVALKNQNSHIVWVNSAGMVLKLSDNQINTGTSDGSDNASVTINAGGAYNSGGSRGAFLRMYGNENGVAGSASLSAGNASAAYVALVAPASNGYFRYIINGNEEWSMQVGTTLIFGTAGATIRANTSDASDSLSLTLCGGGAYNSSGTRGAFMRLYGNESNNGAALIGSGDASGSSLSLSSPASNGYIRMQPGGNDEWLFFVGRDFAFNGGSAQIRSYTNDGSDNRYLLLCGGGGSSSARGAVVSCHGNESSGNAGVLQLDTGNVASTPLFLRALGSGGYVSMAAGGSTEIFRVESSGMSLGGSAGSFGGAAKALFIANGTAASSNPTGGAVIWAEGGAIKARGSSGTVTTLAAA